MRLTLEFAEEGTTACITVESEHLVPEVYERLSEISDHLSALSACSTATLKVRLVGLPFDNNSKIRNIKALRTALGCGLKEAKDWVEAVLDGHQPIVAEGTGAKAQANAVQQEGFQVEILGASPTVYDRLRKS